MMQIGSLTVEDSGTEWCVVPFEGCELECDSLQEAEDLAKLWGTHVQYRRYYVTEWVPLLPGETPG